MNQQGKGGASKLDEILDKLQVVTHVGSEQVGITKEEAKAQIEQLIMDVRKATGLAVIEHIARTEGWEESEAFYIKWFLTQLSKAKV